MFELIFLAVTALYFLTLVYLTSGLSKDFKLNAKYCPSVSVVVAARNEENNIAECILSLDQQDYKNYQVIIADDFSTDHTGSIIDEMIKGKEKFLKIIPETNTNLTGKSNALNSAVKISSGEILVFTDADCIIPPGWISGVVKYYSEETGMVNGFSITIADNISSGMQSIDLVFLVSVAAGLANSGYPASCIGNNMSVKRDVYDLTGGYGKFEKSVTEDYTLINKVASLKKFRSVFPLDADTVITTKPLNNISEIIQQKKRWASGGLTKPNVSLGLMLLAFLCNLLTLLSFLFFSSGVLSIILLKIFAEFFFLYNVHNKLKISNNLRFFLFFEVYYLLYTTFLPLILLLSRKIKWKERIYAPSL